MPASGIATVDSEFERVEEVLRAGHHHGEGRDHEAEQVVTLSRVAHRVGHNRDGARGHVSGDGDADADVGGRDADVVDPRARGARVQQDRNLLLIVGFLVAQVHRDARDDAGELMRRSFDDHGRGRYLLAPGLVARRWWAADRDRHGNRLRRQRVHVDLHRRRRVDELDVGIGAGDRDRDGVRARAIHRRPVHADGQDGGAQRVERVLITAHANQHVVHRVDEHISGGNARRALRHRHRHDLGLRGIARVDHADPGHKRDEKAQHLELPVAPDEPRDSHGCERRPRVRRVPTRCSGRSIAARPDPPSVASSVTSMSWSLVWSRPR